MDQMKSALNELNRIKNDMSHLRDGMSDLMKHLQVEGREAFDKVGDEIASTSKSFYRQATRSVDDSVKAVDKQLTKHPYSSALTALSVLGAGLLIAKMVRK